MQQPDNPRHARMLAQTSFEDAAILSRDGRIQEAIDAAENGVETLLTRPALPYPT